ncbi:hypothetical protein CPB85DRAFT_1447508 [Mucidula mucida]|nr:hypothetical protein CPB85DRAFT_1447508 [Mucidula mucida]
MFSVLNLNAVMSIVADVPATTFATIFSCRVVRRLYQFQQKSPQVYSHSGSSAPRYNPNNPSAIPVSGVHVQMATFVREDDASENKQDVFERNDVKRTGY